MANISFSYFYCCVCFFSILTDSLLEKVMFCIKTKKEIQFLSNIFIFLSKLKEKRKIFISEILSSFIEYIKRKRKIAQILRFYLKNKSHFHISDAFKLSHSQTLFLLHTLSLSLSLSHTHPIISLLHMHPTISLFLTHAPTISLFLSHKQNQNNPCCFSFIFSPKYGYIAIIGRVKLPQKNSYCICFVTNFACDPPPSPAK